MSFLLQFDFTIIGDVEGNKSQKTFIFETLESEDLDLFYYFFKK